MASEIVEIVDDGGLDNAMALEIVGEPEKGRNMEDAIMAMENAGDLEKGKNMEEDDEISTVEQVRVTVLNDDDPTTPVWTFRMWVLGTSSCVLLSFLNTFLGYRDEPLVINMIVVQVASLPLGRFMAKVLPKTKFTIPGFGSRQFSLNPGPFNMKEHALISIFANAGAAFGSGPAYAVGIVTIIKAFYMRKISFLAGWLLVITTQVLGYGWAGILRKYVVDPAEMWWPSSLMQVSLFRALHENDDRKNSRAKFFLIALVCCFRWSFFPGYLVPFLSSMSTLCLLYPKSVTAQQLGSGKRGLGIGSFTLDWQVIAGFNGNPLVTPFFVIANVFVGYVLFAYGLLPVAYWGMNLYNARRFPLFSTDIFKENGQAYEIEKIVNNKFELDLVEYAKQGRMNLSIVFAIAYGLNFAALTASIVHVVLFNGKEILERYPKSHKGKQDIHTRLMKKYADIPNWWFYVVLGVSMIVSLVLCIFMKDQIQLPWWGLIFAAGLAFVFTLPISIITATTNQTPGLNVITEYAMGLIYPGRPIANVCFKTYGYMSMGQAVSFLADFKLGHYMKIPPTSMFIVQFLGTIIAGTVNMGTTWYLLASVENICNQDLLPRGSPWTCANDKVFYDASVLWGLAGPKRIFGTLGNYATLNWWFLVGALAPVCVWMLYKKFPSQKWIAKINMPVILSATANMPPAAPLNFNSWILVGTIFNYFVFKYRKSWWYRYNYVLSAALDAGLAFMTVLIYFCLTNNGIEVSWWGSKGGDHCKLASCPTAKGVVAANCPVF